VMPQAMNYVKEIKKEFKVKEVRVKEPPPLVMKKLVSSVMKVLSRIGRVHKIYTVALGIPQESEYGDTENDKNEYATLADTAQVPEERRHYLLTWETFFAECALEYSSKELVASVVTSEDVRSITKEILAARKTAPCKDPKFRISQCDAAAFPLLNGAEVTPKIVVDCCDRMETAHKIRLALAFLGPVGLEAVLRNCPRVPGTGADTPSFQRDCSMPIWWTFHHDVALLRDTLIYGNNLGTATTFKKLCTGDMERYTAVITTKDVRVDRGQGQEEEQTHISLTNPPHGFEFPPREKNDWVVALLPKAAEKRIGIITRVLDVTLISKGLDGKPLPIGSPVQVISRPGLSSMFGARPALSAWPKRPTKSTVDPLNSNINNFSNSAINESNLSHYAPSAIGDRDTATAPVATAASTEKGRMLIMRDKALQSLQSKEVTEKKRVLDLKERVIHARVSSTIPTPPIEPAIVVEANTRQEELADTVNEEPALVLIEIEQEQDLSAPDFSTTPAATSTAMIVSASAPDSTGVTAHVMMTPTPVTDTALDHEHNNKRPAVVDSTNIGIDAGADSAAGSNSVTATYGVTAMSANGSKRARIKKDIDKYKDTVTGTENKMNKQPSIKTQSKLKPVLKTNGKSSLMNFFFAPKVKKEPSFATSFITFTNEKEEAAAYKI